MAVVTHQANPPDLAGQRTEAAAHLNAVLVEQVEGKGLAIDTLRDPHGGEGGKPQVLGGMELQAKAL